MSSRRTPSVAIVGGGKVGQTLGRLLVDAGYAIVCVVCRTRPRARSAVRFIGAGEPLTVADLAKVTADVVLLTVPDDEIEGAARALAAAGRSFRGTVVLHTSGALDSSVLEPLKRRGAATGSMHPLQSFSSPRLGIGRVRGSAFAVEGTPAAQTAARAIARAVGGRSFTLRAAAKPLYHAAAVMASGHVTALVDASLEAMRGAGLDEATATEAVFPLILGTLANIRKVGTARALTGPFARGDEGTVARNRAALLALDEQLIRVYEPLGERSRVLAKRIRPHSGRRRS